MYLFVPGEFSGVNLITTLYLQNQHEVHPITPRLAVAGIPCGAVLAIKVSFGSSLLSTSLQ